MAITQIQNPYKLSKMMPFDYQPNENKKDNRIGAVSKGFGVISPPDSKKTIKDAIQESADKSHEFTKQVMGDTFQSMKNVVKKAPKEGEKPVAGDREIKTPLGVRIIYLTGLTVAAIAVAKGAVKGLKSLVAIAGNCIK